MVNNAATYSGTALLDTRAEQWEQVMTVNLTGMFYGCKRAVQQMITQEPRQEVRGRVINLGSQHGIVAARRDSPYGVSKAGAIYLTKQIAVDYAKRPHCVQLHFAGKDRDGQARLGDGSGAARARPAAHAVATIGASSRRRQCGRISGERSRDLHHGCESRRGRRMAGGLRIDVR